MEQSPSREANRSSGSQEIPRILWNLKVHYRIHNSPPLVQIDPVHASHVRLGLPNGLLPSGFSTKTLYAPRLSPIRATCPVHLSLLYLITRIVFGEEYSA